MDDQFELLPQAGLLESLRSWEKEQNWKSLEHAIRVSAACDQQEIERRDALCKRLYKDGLDIKEVAGDGHCQFRAIADQIQNFFPEDKKNLKFVYTYKEVRNDIEKWLRKNPDFEYSPGTPISNFLVEDTDGTWEEFCDKVANSSDQNVFWGNHLTLIAAANTYQRQIRIWSDRGHDKTIHPRTITSHRCMHLVHHHEKHYSGVVKLE